MDNESNKTCTVCGIPNHIENKYCINCNSYFRDELPLGNGSVIEIKPINSDRTSAAGKIVLFAFLIILLGSFLVYKYVFMDSSPIYPAKAVPSVALYGEKDSKDFVWKYDGETFNWHIEASKELLAYDREINRQVTAFFHSDAETQWNTMHRSTGDYRKMILSVSDNGRYDLSVWIKDELNDEWAADLAEQLDQTAQENGFDYFKKAEFILSFVGSAIPYQITDFPQLAAQTVFDNGDCKDKSILLAAILRNLDYRVALLLYKGNADNPGHMALGIAFSDDQIPKSKRLSFYEYNGYKYYFAEVTTANWPLGQASVEKPADIIEIDPLNE